MVKVTPLKTLPKEDKKDMVADIHFSKHARRQIGKYIKGVYRIQTSNPLNKQIHLYSPQKLLNVAPPVTDLEAAKQIVNVFKDPIKAEEVGGKMQHSTTNVDNVHRTRPFSSLEINGKGISTRLKTLETALKSLALLFRVYETPVSNHTRARADA